MKSAFKTIATNKLLTSLVLFALGLLLLIAPGEMLTTYVRVIGIILLVAAVLGALSYVLAKMSERSTLTLIGAIAAAIIGVIFTAAPGVITGILPFVFGAMLLIVSVSDLVSAIALPFGKLIGIILSLIGIILGLVIVMDPNGLANFITRLVGLSFIYEAIVGVVTVIFAKRAVR